jgi:hypothetical protein
MFGTSLSLILPAAQHAFARSLARTFYFSRRAKVSLFGIQLFVKTAKT